MKHTRHLFAVRFGSIPRRARYLACFAVALGVATLSPAQTLIWNGGSSTTGNWSDAANWGGNTLASGNNIIFAGITRLNSTNDLSGLSLGYVTMSNSDWNVQGNAVTLASGLFTNNMTGTSTWALNTTLGTTATFCQNATADILNLPGYISGSGGIAKAAGVVGQGEIILDNLTNSFTGQVNVRSGTVVFDSLAPGGSPSSLGEGTTPILVGYASTSYAAHLTFAGTNSGYTDRALDFADLTTSTVTVSNNSPNNSSISFVGATPFTFTDNTANDTFALELAGTSTGTNIFFPQFSSVLWGGNLQIAGPGTWVFSNVFNFAGGTFTIATNSHVALLYNADLPDPTTDVPGFAQITVGGGGTLDLSSFDQNATTFSLAEYGSYPQILVAGRTNTPGTDINGSLSLNGSGGATLNVAGSGVAGTLSISTNLIVGSGAIKMDLNTNTTAGSAINDLILVGGNLDLSQGNGVIAVNAFKGTLNTNTAYTLIAYNGSLLGDASGLSVPPPGRAFNPGVVSTAIPGLVQVTFSPSGEPNASLFWQGGNGPNWDVQTTLNWLNQGSGDYFYQGDNVTFDDTASDFDVNLVGTLTPGSIVVTNNLNNYVISSSTSGLITGGTLTKRGTAELTVTTANTYPSGTVVSAGTISAGNATAFGAGTVTLGDTNTGVNTASFLVNSGVTVVNPILVSSNGTGTAYIGYESGAACAMNGLITLQRDLTIYTTNASGSYSLDIQGGFTGTGNVTITGGGSVKFQNNSSAGLTNSFVFNGNIYLTPGTNQSPATNTTYLGLNPTALSTNCNITVASGTILGIVSAPLVNALNGGGLVEPGYGAAYDAGFAFGNGNGSGTFSGSFATNSLGYYCGVTKNGTGTEIFTGDNSISGGNTVINAGILAVDNTTGYGLGTGGVSVSAGATLAGNGIIYAAGTHTFSVSGIVSVGNAGHMSGTTLTLANNAGLVFNSGGALNVDLFSGAGAGDNTANPAAADILAAQCPVTLQTNSILNVANPKSMTSWAVGDKWKIAVWNSTPTNTFTVLNLPALPSNLTWDTSSLYSAGVIAVASNAGPTEPAEIFGITLSGTNIVINGTNLNGGQNFHYAVLTSTNLMAPLTNWTVLSTNPFNANGTFDFTNAMVPTQPQAFFQVKAVQ